jgi:hypothetical protein
MITKKFFNDFAQFFGEETDICSLTVGDARKFIDWQLNEKIQFLNQKTKKRSGLIYSETQEDFAAFLHFKPINNII